MVQRYKPGSGMDRDVLLRLLLRIGLLLLFASCTLPARLQRKSYSFPSLTPYDYITIGQPFQSSDVIPSLYDYIPTGQPSPPSVSLSSSSWCSCGSQSSGSVASSSSCSCNSTTNDAPPSYSPETASPPFSLVNDTPLGQLSHSPLRAPANITVSAGASRGGLNLLEKIGIAIAVIVVSLLILIAVLKAFRTGSVDIRRHTTGLPANPSANALDMDIIDIRTYTMEELANATDNFTTQVGHGVSGFVYRANLPENRLGAVKRATNLDSDLFKAELSVLLRLPRHPRLVDLIGLCLQGGERILVFEFISSGSLYDRLHKNKDLTSPLSWAARMDIAFQVAVALQYLHEEANPPILHRDVKSANVLLEADNCAKLADFGLSKLGPKDNQFTITAIRGSYGYMDPQYVRTCRYSAKSDVYSFGVLLLELITGLKSLHEETPLAEWTQSYRLSEGVDIFMAIVDPTVIDHINAMELQIMIKIANICLRDIGEERSSMREIVNMMQETRNIKANGNLCDGDEASFLGNGNFSDDGGATSG